MSVVSEPPVGWAGDDAVDCFVGDFFEFLACVADKYHVFMLVGVWYSWGVHSFSCVLRYAGRKYDAWL